MREFIGWARWVWSRQERWQKLWVVGMFFMGMSFRTEGMTFYALISVPLAIFGFYVTKWLVWDTFYSSWNKYKAHRNELLTTIRNSND